MTFNPTTSQLTKVEKLYLALDDGAWHSTKELVRRVGHTFAVAKRQLVFDGHDIEKRRHPSRRFQWQYRMKK